MHSPECRSQDLDYGLTQSNKHIIAILPVRNQIKDIYANCVNNVANHLAHKIRQIKGIETLNVLNSMRKINLSDSRVHFDNISRAYQVSDFPDPDDLYKVAQILNADKIILVSGGFDTQKEMFYRSFKSHLNIFNNYPIKPEYLYTAYISMYDPVTGEMEWSQQYKKKFIFKDFSIAAADTSTNPGFAGVFDKYASEMTTLAQKELDHYFYQAEISTVSSKLLMNRGESVKATEGDKTTDGHPYYQRFSPVEPEDETRYQKPSKIALPSSIPVAKPLSIPYKTEIDDEIPEEVEKYSIYGNQTYKDEHPSKYTIDSDQPLHLTTPYTSVKETITEPEQNDISELKPDFEKDILKNYKKKMIERY